MVSYVEAVALVRHLAPAPLSREVHVLDSAVPVKFAVTVPQSRTFLAVSWCQGRLTDLVSTLPPGASKVTVL
jgi:hypothetical protein